MLIAIVSVSRHMKCICVEHKTVDKPWNCNLIDCWFVVHENFFNTYRIQYYFIAIIHVLLTSQRKSTELLGFMIQFEFVYTCNIRVPFDHRKKNWLSFRRTRKHHGRLNRTHSNREMDKIIHDISLHENIFNKVLV